MVRIVVQLDPAAATPTDVLFGFATILLMPGPSAPQPEILESAGSFDGVSPGPELVEDAGTFDSVSQDSVAF